jgi:uncharacterized protein (DUF1501 family)
VAAFTVSFAAPAFLSDLARAQGATSRSLVVLYLGGGNDSLSMLAPYDDPSYRSRRPTIALPASSVLQVGTDSGGTALGLHPRLAGLRQVFDNGHLALIQRCGYEGSSRSHFQGTDNWATASTQGAGSGWLGRFFETIPSPDPLVCWNTAGGVPRALQGSLLIPSISSVSQYTFRGVNDGAEAAAERTAASRIASQVASGLPQVAFVADTAETAFATLDRVAQVGAYRPSVPYPSNGLGQALLAVAGAMNAALGTRVFWVQTGGYDTHASQGTASGTYANLMTVLNDALFAFYTDLRNQGLLDSALVLQYSEFGRRIGENAGGGTDHGAASVMMAMGGQVRGGLYGSAPSLRPDPGNPTLENNGNDVRYETDFRAVYARVAESWLGADSTRILGGDFRPSAPAFL